MNERIGKLAVEAGAHWEHGDWNMPSAVYFSEKDLEKFAELIVRECMDICKKHPSRDLENGWFADAVAPHLIQQFEEHFGVTE